MSTWTNWSGLVTARPRRTESPASTEEVAAAVTRAAAEGLAVRMTGAGHSFPDVAATDGVRLDPSRLRGVVAVDRDAMTVSVLAGTPLHELNARLLSLGLALHNMGDIDRQTLAGAVSTGTHGTGGVVASLSGQLEAVELVTASGSVCTASRDHNPELFAAAQVGLGAVGVLTTLTLRVEPAFTLEAVERPMSWDEVVGRHDELVAGHHHVDLYWFPHTDRCLVKTNDRTLDDPAPLSRLRSWFDDDLLANNAFGLVDRVLTRRPELVPRANRLVARALSPRSYRDVSSRVFISPRRVVFREMEYALPRAAGIDALREARRLIEAAGLPLGWPVEVRVTPADDAWLSTTSGRDSLYLAFHVGRDVDHRPMMRLLEPMLSERGGRPHWGKLHTRTAADLAPCYPHWADFARVRDRVDPRRDDPAATGGRVFGNAYLDRVLG